MTQQPLPVHNRLPGAPVAFCKIPEAGLNDVLLYCFGGYRVGLGLVDRAIRVVWR